jgi:hypothetical protein
VTVTNSPAPSGEINTHPPHKGAPVRRLRLDRQPNQFPANRKSHQIRHRRWSVQTCHELGLGSRRALAIALRTTGEEFAYRLGIAMRTVGTGYRLASGMLAPCIAKIGHARSAPQPERRLQINALTVMGLTRWPRLATLDVDLACWCPVQPRHVCVLLSIVARASPGLVLIPLTPLESQAASGMHMFRRCAESTHGIPTPRKEGLDGSDHR